ncbi:uncharacterized protein LOC133176907 [Saccostrea echinata]|uniref:uncharacterized protein LOC133176907 n=1 Tax=Saccostrea echinata TaxID=191078 RepID=UPI002A820C36|nr:uncharacterized protein LOC133176907 [Saccostrea echinata]
MLATNFVVLSTIVLCHGQRVQRLLVTGPPNSNERISHLETTVQNLAATVQQLTQRLATVEKYNSNPIYFSAYLTNTFTPPRDRQTNVVYNGVHFDSHKTYNPSTGYFTAPVTGLYVFSWENLTAPGKVFDTELLVNGVSRERDNCNNEGSTAGYLSCTQVLPVKLNAGDLVNIRTTYGNYAHGGWCSFSGWLVR